MVVAADQSQPLTPRWLRAVAGPALVVLLSLLAAAQALRLWEWSPGTPLGLRGDSTQLVAQVRDILDHGWYLSNPDVGAPFGQNAGWFPSGETVHFLAIHLIGLLADSPFTVSAVYFLLGFPFAAITMYWLMRQAGIGRLGAVVGGVLFSVVPTHQEMFGHLWLASYWVVPLGIWLVLKAADGGPLISMPRPGGSWWPAARTALIVLAVGLSGVYYIAFTLILLAIVLLARWVSHANRRAVLLNAAIAGAVGILAVASLKFLTLRNGQDLVTGTTPAFRVPGESERYAGKLMDLVMPWHDHRVGALEYLTMAYNAGATPTVERPALGIVALIGAIALLWIGLLALLTGARPARTSLTLWSGLTAVSLAFYTVGGLGSFVAFFGTPQLRTWSRLFLYVALLGLLAVGYWLTRLARARGARVALPLGVLILVVGVLDQTNPAAAPDYRALRAEMASLRVLTGSLEAELEPGCSILQLPIIPFPEEGPRHGMADYDHFRPYLASQGLRWSYGAMEGTHRADWQLALPQRDPDRLADDAAAAGFCAIEVDTAGYAAGGSPVSSLRSALGASLAESGDGRLVAFDLRERRSELETELGAAAVARRGDQVLHPLTVSLSGRLAEQEPDGTAYQWTGPRANLTVSNMAERPVDRLTLSMEIGAPDDATRTVAVEGPDGQRVTVEVAGAQTSTVVLPLTAGPGMNTFRITTDAPGVRLEDDPDTVAFIKVRDLALESTDPDVNIGVKQSLPR